MDHSVITIAVRPLLGSIGGGDSIVHSPLHPHLHGRWQCWLHRSSLLCTVAPLTALSSLDGSPSPRPPWRTWLPPAQLAVANGRWRDSPTLRRASASTFPIRAAETSSMTTQQEKKRGTEEGEAESTGPNARLAASCAIAGRLSVFLLICKMSLQQRSKLIV